MAMADRKRLVRLGGATLGLLVLASSPLWAANLGRRIAWLEIRRVEISGTRLLAPHEVLLIAGIEAGRHLLDDTSEPRRSLLGHPVIADASISRSAPHTLRIRIAEKEPVALVADGTLRLATAAGEILPVDPHLVPLDLPLVRGTLGDSARAVITRRLLAETDRIAALDEGLMREVSEVRVAAGEPEALILGHRIADIVLPFGAGAARVSELRRVLADVERRFPSRDARGAPVRHLLDLRYGDLIVVRPSSQREFS
jgi:cell division protein FtsQ